MNDEVTILLAQKGDEAAFRKLFVEFRSQVFRWASRYTNTQEDAEDILQETFIKAFRHIADLHNISKASFAQWLKQICVNTSLNQLKKMKRRKTRQTTSLSDLIIEPISGQASPEENIHIQHLFQHIRAAKQQLPAKQRLIFDLRYGQYKNIKEISELMNCTESNVKAHLSRAMKTLRKQLVSFRES